MFSPFERAVAFRYLRARKGERFVSIIAIFSLVGIALGVATLIIVMSVMNGFREDLLGRILGLNGHLGVYGQGQNLTDYDDMARKVRAIPGVVSAMPVLEGQGLLTNDRGAAIGGMARGVDPAELRRLPFIGNTIRAGSLDDLIGDDAVAVGVGMARRFGLTIGSKLTLVSPQGQTTAFGTMPRIRAYRVVAVFEAGVNDYDSSIVFMPLPAAQTFFFAKDSVTVIEVRLDNADRVGEVGKRIRQILAGQTIRVIDWQQSNNSFFEAVQVQQNVMFLILTLIILVAAFNIISSLIMMVKDKARDIAVLRTIGASRGSILRIFLMAGASVGVLGTVIGTVLGLVFCWNIETIQGWVEAITGAKTFNPEVYYLTHLPSRLDWTDVTEVILMALVLSLLATLYPSWRAAQTDPVEALRHE